MLFSPAQQPEPRTPSSLSLSPESQVALHTPAHTAIRQRLAAVEKRLPGTIKKEGAGAVPGVRRLWEESFPSQGWPTLPTSVPLRGAPGDRKGPGQGSHRVHACLMTSLYVHTPWTQTQWRGHAVLPSPMQFLVQPSAWDCPWHALPSPPILSPSSLHPIPAPLVWALSWPAAPLPLSARSPFSHNRFKP